MEEVETENLGNLLLDILVCNLYCVEYNSEYESARGVVRNLTLIGNGPICLMR